jgi:hypothetical protein
MHGAGVAAFIFEDSSPRPNRFMCCMHDFFKQIATFTCLHASHMICARDQPQILQSKIFGVFFSTWRMHLGMLCQSGAMWTLELVNASTVRGWKVPPPPPCWVWNAAAGENSNFKIMGKEGSKYGVCQLRYHAWVWITACFFHARSHLKICRRSGSGHGFAQAETREEQKGWPQKGQG